GFAAAPAVLKSERLKVDKACSLENQSWPFIKLEVGGIANLALQESMGEGIFRYLKGQPKLGLWYPKDSPFDLEAFSDSDYAGASLDRKSTIEGCQFLRKRLIS
nr:putative ribonuclease H-like domain-containing protein [Tanacetum cinerariifolium]